MLLRRAARGRRRPRGPAQRWPRFVPAARRMGFEAVLALPMRLCSEVIGALNLFTTPARVSARGPSGCGQALADVATIDLLQARTVGGGGATDVASWTRLWRRTPQISWRRSWCWRTGRRRHSLLG
jgi:hypothetical protein